MSSTLIKLNPRLHSYYNSPESRIGYRLMLGGTRHFGYYSDSSAWPFPIEKALRAMESKMLEALNLPPRSKVLDCGCGVGHVAMYMATRGGLEVEAFDYMAHHVEKARRNITAAGLQDLVKVRQADYHHLDEQFKDASFDGVYTMETLVHASDPASVLVGYSRLLKPGGVLVLHEYLNMGTRDTVPTEIQRDFEDVCRISHMPAWIMFTPGTLDKMLADAGLEVERTEVYTKNIEPMLWLFWITALIPYYIFKFLGIEKHFINTLAGYNGYRAMKYFDYVQIKARKPGKVTVDRG